MLNKYEAIVKILLSACSLFVLNDSVQSQNNAFKINDGLYAYFVKANKAVRSEKCISMADTLFKKAASIHDQKAQCLALTLKNMHYYFNNDYNMLLKSQKVEQDFAKKTPYLQYIFDPWNRLINYFVNNGQMIEALNEAQKYQAEALKLNNSYGISQSYRKLGDLYLAIGNNDEAMVQFKKAIELRLQLGDERDISDAYYGIAGCYFAMFDYQHAKLYFKKAYDCQVKMKIPATAVGLFMTYADEGIHGDSIAYYKSLADKEYEQGKFNSSNKEYYFEALTYYYTFKKQYDKALEACEKLKSRSAVNFLKQTVYVQMQDYQKAYTYLQQSRMDENKKNTEYGHIMLAHLTAQMNQNKLESDKQRLELNNAKMKLQQSKAHEQLMMLTQNQTTLELKNRQLALESQKALIANSRSKANQAVLEARNEKAEAAVQRSRALLLEKQYSYRNRIILLSFILLGVIILAAFAYIITRHRQIKQLRREKDLADRATVFAEEERKKAEQADRLKSLFLQNMSHEIRTPLNAIVGFNEVLNGEMSNELEGNERKELTESIRTNSDLLITLVNDILDLSKFESGLYKLDMADACAQDICKNAIASSNARFPRGVEIKSDFDERPIVIHTDAQRVQQLLINLLTNASKYTTNGSICISCHLKQQTSADRLPDQQVVEMMVTDTGTGIPAEMGEKIFDRFEKLDNFKQGTGLGLSICRQIATLLNGDIFVDGSYTKGARLVFLHPYK